MFPYSIPFRKFVSIFVRLLLPFLMTFIILSLKQVVKKSVIQGSQTIVLMKIVPSTSIKTDVRCVCVMKQEISRGVMERKMNSMTSTLRTTKRNPTVSTTRAGGIGSVQLDTAVKS